MDPSDAADPIQRMVAEHRVIEGVLTALARFGEAVARGEPVEPERLPDFVMFLSGYADAIHHGKEERIVFAALRRLGAPPALTSRLSAIERDHETARLLIGDLAALSRTVAQWSDRDRAAVVRAIGDYVSLLRRHIRDEDRAVFPDSWAAIPAPQRPAVSDACARFDAEHAEAAADLVALAERLAGGAADAAGSG